MDFYPEPKHVPEHLRTADLYLEMLAPEHVEMDYAAFMSSRPRLRLWSGGRWPTDDFTLEDNLEDMVMHRDEFLDRVAFAYTVLNSDASRCEGCVYIYPWWRQRDHLKPVAEIELPDDAAIVTYWVRDDALDRELDRQLLAGLLNWFEREWEFNRVLFLANRDQQRDLAHFKEEGLARRFTIDAEYPPGRFYLYGAERLGTAD